MPVEKMERDAVEMYAEDRRARAQEVFIPLRRLCGRRPVSSASASQPAAFISFYSCF